MNREMLKALVEGYGRFYKSYYLNIKNEHKKPNAYCQFPKVMFITCCDSRVNPAIMTDANLGEIFVVQNIANIIPVYEQEATGYHGTSAALEFAIKHLEIECIVVLGHSNCGGIKAMMSNIKSSTSTIPIKKSFIESWLDIVTPAKLYVEENFADRPFEEKLSIAEKRSIVISLDNLSTFPWIRSRLDEGQLEIYGWYFDISTGVIQYYDRIGGSYKDLFNC